MCTIIATMVGYALFYFVRKNFSFAMPGMDACLGITKVSLGVFLTLNGLIYRLFLLFKRVYGRSPQCPLLYGQRVITELIQPASE